MADRLAFIGMLSLLLSPLVALAESLVDPTRPPSLVATPGAGEIVDAVPAGLTSILISKERRAAIIDGETVELGARHGGARLIEIHEGFVVMKGSRGRQVLTLFPEVKMTRSKVVQMIRSKGVQEKPHKPVTKAPSGKKQDKPVAHKEEK
ncbi:MAG: hypothetical protein U1C96_06155 [Gallionella sp.]|nr:hypothetical protein [Gallionella sp.]